MLSAEPGHYHGHSFLQKLCTVGYLSNMGGYDLLPIETPDSKNLEGYVDLKTSSDTSLTDDQGGKL